LGLVSIRIKKEKLIFACQRRQTRCELIKGIFAAPKQIIENQSGMASYLCAQPASKKRAVVVVISDFIATPIIERPFGRLAETRMTWCDFS